MQPRWSPKARCPLRTPRSPDDGDTKKAPIRAINAIHIAYAAALASEEKSRDGENTSETWSEFSTPSCSGGMGRLTNSAGVIENSGCDEMSLWLCIECCPLAPTQ